MKTVPAAAATELSRVAKIADQRLVAQELATRLGLKLTAAIGKVTETRRVQDWITKGTARRVAALRAALQATVAIASLYDDAAARAWFMSANPGLGMRSPLAFIRDADDIDELDRLVATAVQDL